IYFIIFFFSSIRRHTRSYGDWSSDVCSSDLPPSGANQTPMLYNVPAVVERVCEMKPSDPTGPANAANAPEWGLPSTPVKPVLPEIGRASCRERGEVGCAEEGGCDLYT